MKKNILRGAGALLLSAAILCGAAGTGTAAGAGSPSEPQPQQLNAAVLSAAVPGKAAGKDETVYIIADAAGQPEQVIVSDWLKNPKGYSALEDETALSDVENVKGSGALSVQNGVQIWDAQGEDVYYQSVTDQALPVSVAVTYTLDGRTVSPSELAGKSGRLVIRFDYENHLRETVAVGGERETLHVPFAAVTAAILDSDTFTNVEVVNGRLVNDGGATAVVGLAFPGLAEDLDLKDGQLELPDYLEIRGDAKEFEMAGAVTVVTSEPFSQLDAEDLEDLAGGDLSGSLDKMTDAMDQLLDGSSQLCDGLDALLEGTNALSDGVDQLAGGLSALSANSAALTDGSRQVFQSLLDTANQQLDAAGLDLPELTVENYSQVLAGALSAMDEAGVTQTARQQVEETVRGQTDAVRQAVAAAVEQEVSAQVQEALRADVESQVLASMGLTAEDLAAAPKAQREQIDAAVDRQLSSAAVKEAAREALARQMASQEVQTLVDAKAEEQIQSLTDQAMASDEVQARIAAGLEQASSGAASLSALKAQLDSYNTFYTGLAAYTGGVDEAAAGAGELKRSVPALTDGVRALRDGAASLSDGLAQFNEEAVQKLAGALDGDLGGLTDRLEALSDLARSYQNFSGIPQDVEGQVRFLYRLGSIQLPEED